MVNPSLGLVLIASFLAVSGCAGCAAPTTEAPKDSAVVIDAVTDATIEIDSASLAGSPNRLHLGRFNAPRLVST